MTANPDYEFSFRVDVHSLPDVGRHYAIEADAAARARVATRLELPEISSLKATFDLTPGAGDIVNVAGVVEAELIQTCVVTLGPVPASLREPVEARFTTFVPPKTPPKPSKSGGKEADNTEELVYLGDDEPPEEAVNGVVDLGELAVVHLALGLDPYPRAPGAAFKAGSWQTDGEKSEVLGPFAALAKLKKKSQPESP